MSLADYYKQHKQASAPEPETPVLADATAVHTLLAASQMAQHQRDTEAFVELAQEYENLDELTHAVESLNQAGGMRRETAALALMGAEACTRRLGFQQSLMPVAALESIDEHGNVMLSTETLVNSMEGVGEGMKEIMKRQWSAALRANSFLFVQTRTQRARLEALLELVRTTSGNKPKVETVEVRMKNLHEDGKIPADVFAFLSNYYRFMEEFNSNFPKRAVAAMRSAYKTAAKLNFASEDEFKKTLKEFADTLPDPRANFGAALKAPMPGGHRLFEDRALRYKGSDPSAIKLDKYARQNYPVRLGFMTKRKAAFKTAQLKPLTKDQVTALATRARDIAQQASSADQFIEQFMSSTYSAIPSLTTALVPIFFPVAAGMLIGVTGTRLRTHNAFRGITNRDVRSQFKDEIRTARDAIRTVNYLLWHTWFDSMQLCYFINNDMVAYARKSLLAYR